MIGLGYMHHGELRGHSRVWEIKDRTDPRGLRCFSQRRQPLCPNCCPLWHLEFAINLPACARLTLNKCCCLQTISWQVSTVSLLHGQVQIDFLTSQLEEAVMFGGWSYKLWDFFFFQKNNKETELQRINWGELTTCNGPDSIWSAK